MAAAEVQKAADQAVLDSAEDVAQAVGVDTLEGKEGKMELAAGMDRKHELAQSEAGGMEGQERKVEQEDASSNARSKGCGNPLPGTPWYNKTVNRQQRRADEAVHRLGQLKKDATFFMIQGCQSHRLRARAGGDAKPLRFLLLYYKEWRHFCLECEKQERGW